jgi:hypothetical protein
MSNYIFENAAKQAAQRFTSLETLYDPWTIRHLEATGIGQVGNAGKSTPVVGDRGLVGRALRLHRSYPGHRY